MTLRFPFLTAALVSSAAALWPVPGRAQATLGAEAQRQAPQSLVLLFANGSSTVRPQDEGLLDAASRLYREGHPVVMILSGSTDSTGQPEANLRLSQQRATAVLHGLVARGIPAERFQLLAKGSSEPAVPDAGGMPSPENRRVEIRWR